MAEITAISPFENVEKTVEQEGYRDIKPERYIKISEAKDFLSSLFEESASQDTVKNCPIEGNSGYWEGDRGNSQWIPGGDSIPPEIKGKTQSNPDGLSWEELLDKYEIDGIFFEDGSPIFDKVSKGIVEIEGFTDNRTDNFDKADIKLAEQKGCTPDEVAQWRKDNNYTWHEEKDMKTMKKVPNEIHANVPHGGGVSEYKKASGE